MQKILISAVLYQDLRLIAFYMNILMSIAHSTHYMHYRYKTYLQFFLSDYNEKKYINIKKIIFLKYLYIKYYYRYLFTNKYTFLVTKSIYKNFINMFIN